MFWKEKQNGCGKKVEYKDGCHMKMLHFCHYIVLYFSQCKQIFPNSG